jgi:hypothetical protein
MSYLDIDKKRAYQRKWVAARRKEWFTGKRCTRCKSTERLELDHIDRKTKVTNSIWSWSEERRDAEIAKCQVLCHICHVKKSIEKDWLQPAHGQNGMYEKHGCRCALCRQWKKKKNAKRYIQPS